MTTYYAAPNGSDSRTAAQAQNLATPWLSITPFMAIAQPGDVLEFQPGTYTPGTKTWPNGRNGTSAAKIIVRGNLSGPRPTFNGTGGAAMTIQNASYIRFEHMNVHGFRQAFRLCHNTVGPVPGPHHIDLVDMDITLNGMAPNAASPSDGIGVYIKRLGGSYVSGCTPAHDLLLSYLDIHEGDGQGVMIAHGSHTITIDHCNIWNFDDYEGSDGDADGICVDDADGWPQSHDIHISHCTVDHCAEDCIDMKCRGDNNTISDTTCHQTGIWPSGVLPANGIKLWAAHDGTSMFKVKFTLSRVNSTIANAGLALETFGCVSLDFDHCTFVTNSADPSEAQAILVRWGTAQGVVPSTVKDYDGTSNVTPAMTYKSRYTLYRVMNAPSSTYYVADIYVRNVNGNVAYRTLDMDYDAFYNDNYSNRGVRILATTTGSFAAGQIPDAMYDWTAINIASYGAGQEAHGVWSTVIPGSVGTESILLQGRNVSGQWVDVPNDEAASAALGTHFGTVQNGSVAVQKDFRIYNTGSTPVSVSPITGLSGSWSVVTDATTPIPAGGFITVTLQMATGTNGNPLNDTAQFTWGAGATVFYLNVTGVVQTEAPEATFTLKYGEVFVTSGDATPSGTDGTLFAAQEQGTNPTVHQFVLTNTSGEDLALGIIGPSGYTYVLSAALFGNGETLTLDIAQLTAAIGATAGPVQIQSAGSSTGVRSFTFAISGEITAPVVTPKFIEVYAADGTTQVTDGMPPDAALGTAFVSAVEGSGQKYAQFVLHNHRAETVTFHFAAPAGFNALPDYPDAIPSEVTIADNTTTTFKVFFLDEVVGSKYGPVQITYTPTGGTLTTFSFYVQGTVTPTVEPVEPPVPPPAPPPIGPPLPGTTTFRLGAINEMLTDLGLRPITDYTTGIAAEANACLESWSMKIQERGWHCNTESDVKLSPPTIRITYTGGWPTAVRQGEQIVEAVTAAFGRYCYADTEAVYIAVDDSSPAFEGGQLLTCRDSGASVAGGTLTSVTEGWIYVDCNILSADPTDWGYPDVTLRGRRFYNRDGNTFTFTSYIEVEQVRYLDFEDLPISLRDLITVHALLDFCSKIKTPLPQDSQKRLSQAELRAMQEDLDRLDINLAHSPYFRRLMGRSGSRFTRR
jgi:hypothetical protein